MELTRSSLILSAGDPSEAPFLTIVGLRLTGLGETDLLSQPGEHQIVHSEAATRPEDYPADPSDLTGVLTVVGPMGSGGFYYSRSGTLTITEIGEATVQGTLELDLSASPTDDVDPLSVRLSFTSDR